MRYIVNETGLKENKYIIDIHCTFNIKGARKKLNIFRVLETVSRTDTSLNN